MVNTSEKMMRTLLFSAMLTFSTLNVHADSPQGFFFFGDSLSDSGYQNNNPVVKNLGKSPQWTSPDGHTWVYYFLQDYAQHSPNMNTTLMPNNMDAAALFNPVPTNITPVLDGNNFAAGGSTTGGPGIINNKSYKAPSLLDQVDYFVHVYSPKHAVNISQNEYLIWSGNNDLIKKLALAIWKERLLQKLYLARPASALHLFDLHSLPAQFTTIENQIADNLLSAVNTLQQAGADKIVVLLLPNAGAAPLMSSLTQGLQQNGSGTISTAELSADMLTVSNDTNALIRKKLATTRALIIDVNEALRPLTSMVTPDTFHETPQQFGKQKDFLIANNKGTACLPKKLALSCIPTIANAKHYVFEDLVHPTDQTYNIIGDYVYYQSQLQYGMH